MTLEKTSKMQFDRRLRRAARHFRIQTSYRSGYGKTAWAKSESLICVLRSFLGSFETPEKLLLHAEEKIALRSQESLIQEALVAFGDKPFFLHLRSPEPIRVVVTVTGQQSPQKTAQMAASVKLQPISIQQQISKKTHKTILKFNFPNSAILPRFGLYRVKIDCFSLTEGRWHQSYDRILVYAPSSLPSKKESEYPAQLIKLSGDSLFQFTHSEANPIGV
jgi:hypothetical protein